MNKKITTYFSATIILAAIVLAIPFCLGIFTEIKAKQVVEIINLNSPFNIEITNYQRGWFSSESTILVTLVKNQNNNQLRQLIINAHISHGPIIINWERIRLAQAAVKAEINLNAKQVADAKMLVHLNGEGTSAIESQPFNYQDATTTINWQGLRLHFDFSTALDKINSTLDLPGANLTLNGETVTLKDLHGDYDGKKTSAGLWIGERNFTLNSFALKKPSGKNITLNDFSLHNITTAQNDTADSVTSINLSNLNIDDAIYSQNHIDLAITKLNSATMLTLQRQIKGLLSGEDLSLQQITECLNTVLVLLSKGAEVNLTQLKSTTPWGNITATFKADFIAQPNANSPFVILGDSTAIANLKLEQKLAIHLIDRFTDKQQDAATTLTKWLKANDITIDKDGTIHFDATYDKHQLLINSKPVTISIKQ